MERTEVHSATTCGTCHGARRARGCAGCSGCAGLSDADTVFLTDVLTVLQCSILSP